MGKETQATLGGRLATRAARCPVSANTDMNLTDELECLRKIAAHVPPMIYLKAKEDAGYGCAIRTRGDSVMEQTLCFVCRKPMTDSVCFASQDLSHRWHIRCDPAAHIALDYLRRKSSANRLEWEDWERWAAEVLTDFKIPFDNHKAGMRSALTRWMADYYERDRNE